MEVRPRTRRGPATSIVRAVNEAAARAKRQDITIDEWMATALWAAQINQIPHADDYGKHPLFGDAHLPIGWAAMYERMEDEKA